MLRLVFLVFLLCFPTTAFCGMLSPWWEASVVLDITYENGSQGGCSGFFARVNGVPKLITADHCCWTPSTPSSRASKVVVLGEYNGKDIELSLTSVGPALESDPLQNDVCMLPTKGYPIPKTIPSVEMEPVLKDGGTFIQRVLVVSRMGYSNDLSTVCPPVYLHSVSTTTTLIATKAFVGPICPGQSGGMVVNPDTGGVVGVVVLGSWSSKGLPSAKDIRPRGGYVSLTYTGWLFESFLKQSFPPLPGKP